MWWEMKGAGSDLRVGPALAVLVAGKGNCNYLNGLKRSLRHCGTVRNSYFDHKMPGDSQTIQEKSYSAALARGG
jgi:hypothetical protein